MRKRWKYKTRSGEEVIIHDVCEKIIGWIEKFIAVGDVAMQYDPTHASLPWAGVRFLLQVGHRVSDAKDFLTTVTDSDQR